jgi:hypothetical protein
MLAKEPADRPKDVAEVLSMLAAVQYVPTVSRRTVTLQPGLTAQPAPVADTAPEKPSKRLPAWIWAATVVLLIAAAFAAGRVFSTQPTKPAPDAPPQTVAAVGPQSQSESNPATSAGGTPVVTKSEKAKLQPGTSRNPAGDKATSDQQPKPATVEPAKAPVAKPDPPAIKAKGEALYAEKSYPEAAGLFRQACDLGNEYSCNHLGFMYREGEGVGQDYSRAFALFSQACSAGSTGGCDNLGILYDKGWGVAQDSSRAASYFTKGCDGGGGNACTNLGILYLEGRGFEKNREKGKELLNKGCSLGDSRGCARLERVK